MLHKKAFLITSILGLILILIFIFVYQSKKKKTKILSSDFDVESHSCKNSKKEVQDQSGKSIYEKNKNYNLKKIDKIKKCLTMDYDLFKPFHLFYKHSAIATYKILVLYFDKTTINENGKINKTDYNINILQKIKLTLLKSNKKKTEFNLPEYLFVFYAYITNLIKRDKSRIINFTKKQAKLFSEFYLTNKNVIGINQIHFLYSNSILFLFFSLKKKDSTGACKYIKLFGRNIKYNNTLKDIQSKKKDTLKIITNKKKFIQRFINAYGIIKSRQLFYLVEIYDYELDSIDMFTATYYCNELIIKHVLTDYFFDRYAASCAFFNYYLEEESTNMPAADLQHEYNGHKNLNKNETVSKTQVETNSIVFDSGNHFDCYIRTRILQNTINDLLQEMRKQEEMIKKDMLYCKMQN